MTSYLFRKLSGHPLYINISVKMVNMKEILSRNVNELFASFAEADNATNDARAAVDMLGSDDFRD